MKYRVSINRVGVTSLAMLYFLDEVVLNADG